VILAADTHVHLYPGHDIANALRSATRRLDRLAPPDHEGLVRALLLAERHDCRIFQELASGACRPAACEVAPTAETTALALRTEAGEIYLFSGRQIVTQERLEVLALTTGEAFDQGRTLDETVAAVLASGALAVLPWSPGKWIGARGRLVRAFIERTRHERLFVADSALRPSGWPRPRLLARAADRGLGVLAGSDPLPLPGEEGMVGRLGVVAAGIFDTDRPTESVRRLLTRGPRHVSGSRRSPAGTVRALVRLRLGPRHGGSSAASA
jgi:hypothetical protein